MSQTGKIKGTEYTIESVNVYKDFVSGYTDDDFYVQIPREWVEVERQEPPIGSVELDKAGDVWVRFNDGWGVNHADCKSEAINDWNVSWSYLQDNWGPTKPMKVIEE